MSRAALLVALSLALPVTASAQFGGPVPPNPFEDAAPVAAVPAEPAAPESESDQIRRLLASRAESPESCRPVRRRAERALRAEERASSERPRAVATSRFERASRDLTTCLAAHETTVETLIAAAPPPPPEPGTVPTPVALAELSTGPALSTLSVTLEARPLSHTAGETLRGQIRAVLGFGVPTPPPPVARDHTDRELSLLVADFTLRSLTPLVVARSVSDEGEVYFYPSVTSEAEAASARRFLSGELRRATGATRTLLLAAREANDAALALHRRGAPAIEESALLGRAVNAAKQAVDLGAPRETVMRELDGLVRRIEWGT